MQTSCDSMSRLPFAPLKIARSREWQCRLSRTLILCGVLLGQTGLPNFADCFSASTSCQHPDAPAGAKCQCPPSLRRVGRCCCASKKSANTAGCRTACGAPVAKTKKSCCQKKTAALAASSTPRGNDKISEVRDDCPCGNGSDVFGYRCTDPRLMPPRIDVSPGSVRIFLVQWVNDAPCGERLPPVLPPPEILLG